MKLFVSLFVSLFIVGSARQAASAQPSYGAEAYAQRQQQEQRWKKLSAQMEEMLASQEVMRERIKALEEENRRLLKKINDSGSASVSPAALNKTVEQLEAQTRQVDKNRQKDFDRLNKRIDTAINKLERMIKNLPAVGSGGGRPTASPSGKYYTHTIQSGQTISAVAAAFRKQGIKVFDDDIIAANPGIKPNKLQVGQVIKVPKP
jgi:LysM repeat protein